MTMTMPTATRRASEARIRVMIVDDSVVVRGLVTRWVENESGFEVVAAVSNGRIALETLAAAAPDIMLLDLDMPELDGFTALPMLLHARPSMSIVVVSTLTQRNAELSLRCLAVGAVDYLPKPGGPRELTLSLDFRQELLAKLDGIAGRHRPGDGVTTSARATPIPPPRALHHRSAKPRALVIGASTGGPRALTQVLKSLGRVCERVPILLVQHMPPIFTTVFAQQLQAETGLTAREGRDGEDIEPGRVYVAPGGRHMGLGLRGAAPAIRLDDGPAIRHCRPALDILLRDAADIYGAGAAAVILTGMGSDGLDGARALSRLGGRIIVQDEATSTVWGMPGSIARAGLADHVLPLSAIAGMVEATVLGDGSSGGDRDVAGKAPG